MAYEIQSAKNSELFDGPLSAAVERAIQINEELQPAFGVTVYLDNTAIWSTEDDRQPDDWWAWHDEASARFSPSVAEAEARCAAWLAGDTDDGPE